jgi:SOS-response transcriptional repressor LexA
MTGRAGDTGVLSVRQHRILQVIQDYWAIEGYGPSVRDVARLAGCSSSSAAYQIGELEAAGRVTHTARTPRSLRVVQP